MSATYYVERARRPKNCWDCDGYTACRCDAVTIRAVKRAARAVWRRRISAEVDEHHDFSGSGSAPGVARSMTFGVTSRLAARSA